MRKASFRASQFKMVLLGDQAVGKSSIALRFSKGRHNENSESTIGAAFITHTLQIDDETSVRVELWDTAGQERYHSLAPMYYRGAQAALVVYDITSAESFRRAKMWVRELRQVNGNEMVIGLAGNKADLSTGIPRQVDKRETEEYAEENNLIFMETSAKRGDNVMEMFINIAKQVLAKQAANTSSKSDETIHANDSKGKTDNSCCRGGHKNKKKT